MRLHAVTSTFILCKPEVVGSNPIVSTNKNAGQGTYRLDLLSCLYVRGDIRGDIGPSMRSFGAGQPHPLASRGR